MFPHCQLSPLSIWRTWTNAQWSTNDCGSLVKANTNFGLLSTLVFNDSVEENIHDVIWFPFENIVLENHNKAGQTVHIYVIMWAPLYCFLRKVFDKIKMINYLCSKCKFLFTLCLLNTWPWWHRRNHIWGSTIKQIKFIFENIPEIIFSRNLLLVFLLFWTAPWRKNWGSSLYHYIMFHKDALSYCFFFICETKYIKVNW